MEPEERLHSPGGNIPVFIFFAVQGIAEPVQLQNTEHTAALYQVFELFPERLRQAGKYLACTYDMLALLPLLRDLVKDVTVHLLRFQAIEFQVHFVNEIHYPGIPIVHTGEPLHIVIGHAGYTGLACFPGAEPALHTGIIGGIFQAAIAKANFRTVRQGHIGTDHNLGILQAEPPEIRHSR